jgi:triosephosphate isomerase
MCTSYTEAQLLVKEVLKCPADSNQVTKIFFPPFPYLKSTADELVNTKNFFTGAQNCSEHEKGAFTGEISAAMLSSVGCKYVLIGHSERRTYFNENDRQLKLKIEHVLKNNLIPVFCFGEKITERKSGKHFDTVKTQLAEVLKNFDKEAVKNFILAYEPVWAIGTGETATPQQAQEMHAFVRTWLKIFFDETLASNISILYGGSCNAQNAKELFACTDVDGGLIGGASLKAEDFCKIIASF